MYLIPSLLLVLFLGRPVYLNTSSVDPLGKTEELKVGVPFEFTSEVLGRSQPQVTFIWKNQSLVTYGVMQYTYPSAKILITTVAKLRVTTFQPILVTCQVTFDRDPSNIPFNIEGYSDCDYLDSTEFQVKIGEQQPRIVYYDRVYKEAVGYDAVLPCRVTGNEWAHRVWTNNNNRTVKNGDDNKYYISYDGDLTIKNLNEEDGGVYKCEVRNRHGTDEIQTDVYVLRN